MRSKNILKKFVNGLELCDSVLQLMNLVNYSSIDNVVLVSCIRMNNLIIYYLARYGPLIGSGNMQWKFYCHVSVIAKH